jgi:hypothetical protein
MKTKRNFYVGSIVGAVIMMLIFGGIAYGFGEIMIVVYGSIFTAMIYGGGALMIKFSDQNFDADDRINAWNRSRTIFEFIMGLCATILI